MGALCVVSSQAAYGQLNPFEQLYELPDAPRDGSSREEKEMDDKVKIILGREESRTNSPSSPSGHRTGSNSAITPMEDLLAQAEADFTKEQEVTQLTDKKPKFEIGDIVIAKTKQGYFRFGSSNKFVKGDFGVIQKIEPTKGGWFSKPKIMLHVKWAHNNEITTTRIKHEHASSSRIRKPKKSEQVELCKIKLEVYQNLQRIKSETDAAIAHAAVLKYANAAGDWMENVFD